PLPIATGVIVILLVLGSPFLHINLGLPDDRVLPASAPARQVHDELRLHFSSREMTTVSVVAPTVDPQAEQADIDAYAARLSSLRDVARVDAVTGSYLGGHRVIGPNPASARFTSTSGTWLSVVPDV